MSATPESGCAAPPARRSGGRSPDVPTWICSTRPPARPGLLVRCRQLRSSAAPRLLRAASAVVLLTCRRGPARPHPAARPRPARLARPMSATPEIGCAAPPAGRFDGRSPELATRAAWGLAACGPARLVRDLPARSRQLRSPAAPRVLRAVLAVVLLTCRRGFTRPARPPGPCRLGHATGRPRPGPSGPPGPRPARAKSATPEFGCAAPPKGRFGGRSPELSTSTSEAPRSAAAERRTGVPDAARRSGTASTGTPVRTQEAR